MLSTSQRNRKSARSQVQPGSSGTTAPGLSLPPAFAGAGKDGAGSPARLTGDPVTVLQPYRVHQSFDKLKVTFWVDWHNSAFFDFLQLKKDALQETDALDFLPIRLHGADWNVSRTGVKLYPFRLIAGDVTLLLSRRNSDKGLPSCSLEIGSLSSQTNLQNTVSGAKAFIEACGGKFVKEIVSEVHLAVDFIGLHISDLTFDNKDRWISRARSFSLYYSGFKFTGCTLGQGDLMLRCYDKGLELRDSEHKQKVFAELWNLPTYDAAPVTRVEFQIRRPILKDFIGKESPEGVSSVDQLMGSLSSLWSYLTCEWVRLSETDVDRDNGHQADSKVSEFWQALQKIEWGGFFSVTRFKKQMNKDLFSLRKQVLGGMMSVLAFYHDDIYDYRTLNNLARDIITEDLKRMQSKDESKFIRRMMTKRNEACFDLVPF